MVPPGAPQPVAKIDTNAKRVSASTLPMLVGEMSAIRTAPKEIGMNLIISSVQLFFPEECKCSHQVHLT